jgi:hypothetical protein
VVHLPGVLNQRPLQLTQLHVVIEGTSRGSAVKMCTLPLLVGETYPAKFRRV